MTHNQTLVITGSLLGLGLLAWLLWAGQTEKEEEPRNPGKTPVPPKKVAMTVTGPLSPKAVPEQKAKTVIKPAPLKVLPPVAKPAPTPEGRPPGRGDAFPLRPGSKGLRVERLNVWLMRNYGHSGLITDDYDADTDRKVKRHLKKDQVDQKLYRYMRMGKPVHGQRIIR